MSDNQEQSTTRRAEPCAEKAGVPRPQSASAGSLECKPWPVWYALVTAWLLPVTTTRRTAGVSLAGAYVFHVATALATAVFAGLLSTWVVLIFAKPYGTRFVDVIGQAFHDAWRFADSQPAVAAAFVFGIAVGVELFFLAMAMLVMPFGARLELTDDSIRHALRRTWLHTGHLVPLILLPLLIFMATEHATRQWGIARWGTMQQPLMPPAAPADPASAEQASEYDRAVKEFQRKLDVRFEKCRTRWYIVYRGELRLWPVLACCLWFCWALLRGITAERPTPELDLADLCRGCGYNLTGLPRPGRCPECGHDLPQPVEDRPACGAPWERRFTLGRWRAFSRTSVLGISDPGRLAVDLRLASNGVDPLRFLIIHVTLAALIFYIAHTVAKYAGAVHWVDHKPPREFYTLQAPLRTFGFAFILLAYASATTLIVNLRCRRHDECNVMCGVAQAACYSSGYFPLMTALFSVALLGLWLRDFWLFDPYYSRSLGSLIWKAIFYITVVYLILGYYRRVRAGAAVVRFASDRWSGAFDFAQSTLPVKAGPWAALQSLLRREHWPGWLALLTAWVKPATTAQRTARVSLAMACICHLVALAFMGCAFFGLMHEILVIRPAFPRDTLGHVVVGWAQSVMRTPGAEGKDLALIAVCIEVIFLGLALVGLTFGARAEPLRHSALHALRRAWLHTGHFALVLLLPCVVLWTALKLERRWRYATYEAIVRRIPYPPRTSEGSTAAGAQGGRPDYYAWRGKVEFEYNRIPKPWHVEYWWKLPVCAFYACCVWFVWGFLRGILARRPEPCVASPATDMDCGRHRGRPPPSDWAEVGEISAVDPSQAANRTETARSRRAASERRASPWRIRGGSLLRPPELTRDPPVRAARAGHLYLLSFHILCSAVLFCLGRIGAAWTADWFWYLHSKTLSSAHLLAWSTGFAVLLLGFVILVILVLGFYHSLRDRRNLLGGMAPIACHCSGYFPPATVLWGLATIALTFWAPAFGSLDILEVFRAQASTGWVSVSVAAMLLLGYVRLVHKAASEWRAATTEDRGYRAGFLP